MTTHAGTDVQHFLDSHPFSRYQKLILWLCFLIVAIDGFDTASIGFIAPAIRAEWGLTPAALAPLFGAGLFGLMAGSFLFGPLADRYGRRPVLIVSVAFFGAASLLSAWSTDLTMLLVLRFLTGLGLGGAMPTSVTMMFCGFTIGSALGGLASAQLLHLIGWRGVLMLGGALPLLLVPVLLLALPESLRWLVLKGRDGSQKIMRRIAPTLAALPRLVVSDKKLAGSPMAELFRPGVIGGTLLLWSTFFMSLLIIYLLSSWMPTLLNGNGLSLSNASLVTMMFQVGGTVGAIMLGRWMDRYSPHKVLSIAYLAAAGCIVVVALSGSSLALLVLAVFGVGFGVSGSQVGANALAAAFYPTSSRATGVSWAAAVGRSGSVLGSMAGGLMLTLKLDNETIFFLLAIPAVLASLALLAMGRLMRTRTAVGAVPATLKESTV